MSPRYAPPALKSPAAVTIDRGTVAKRILIVDDEESIRLALSKFLRTRGYEVETVDSGRGAIDLLRRREFVLMLCDIRMPGMSGIDLVSHAVALDADLAVMVLSAVNDAPTATEALANGASDYLMKPIELTDLQRAVERALQRRDLAIAQRRSQQLVREEVALRTAALERERLALRSLTVSIVETLINAMEAKDVYLRGHSQRVAELGASVAAEMALSEDEIEAVRTAGRLHDVGKIGIREDILNKPGRLTPEEFAHVKDHVRIGMEILAPLKHLGPVLDYVHDHHEHVDGSGYPRGLSAEAISLGGRILAAADAFDALTSKRAYREQLSAEHTLEHLGGYVGALLDAEVYRALAAVVRGRKVLAFVEET